MNILATAIGAATPFVFLNFYLYYKNTRYLKILMDVMRETVIEIDAKDPYFSGHSRRVAEYSIEIGKKMGFSSKKLLSLEVACYFTEVGKIRMPDKILTKRDKLTNEEYEIIKKHPVVAYKMIENIKELKKVAGIVRSHHERYDGNGYPDSLLGDSIPLESRIINVVDSYDAMTSERPYKKVLTKEEAIDELLRNKNKQFDSEIVDIFIKIIK